MSVVALKVPPQFTVGMSVKAYPDTGQQPSGPPAVASLETAVVDVNSVLTFSTLRPTVTYWAGALVSGVWLYFEFTAPPTGATAITTGDLAFDVATQAELDAVAAAEASAAASESQRIAVLEEGPLHINAAPYNAVSGEAPGSKAANDAAFAAAAAALPAEGGTIAIDGNYLLTNWDLTSKSCVKVVPARSGGRTEGGYNKARLVFDGSVDKPLKLVSSVGCELDGVQVMYSGSMVGKKLIDCTLARNPLFRRGVYGGEGVSDCDLLFELDRALGGTWDDVKFMDAKIFVKGRKGDSDSTQYSNTHHFRHILAINAGTVPFRDPGDSWLFTLPTGQALASGAAGFMDQLDSTVCRSCTIDTPWFGDVNASGTWISLGGRNLRVVGGLISNGAIGIDLKANFENPEITCGLDTIVTGIRVAPGCVDGKLLPSYHGTFTNKLLYTGAAPTRTIRNDGTTVAII